MILEKIDGALLKEMVVNGAILLDRQKEEVNALNVFPVPDGDTGINMSMTIQSAVGEMAKADVDGVGTMAEALSRGALKGARGNSGVILSQLFRGFYQSMKDKQVVDAKEFANALSMGVDMAYKAVMKPREGTVLTVSRAVAEAAVREAQKSNDIISIMRKALDYGKEILLKTPDMLDVLKQAGVVDAGGQGLLLIYEGYYSAISGEEPLGDIAEFENTLITKVASAAAMSEEEITFGYCTEFFIINMFDNVTDEDIERLKRRYSLIGDSLVVVGDQDMLKVHVHSDMPGKVLQYAMRLGELSNIKIDNMRYQHSSLLNEDLNKSKAPKKEFGVVAVAAGEGLEVIFKDLGVDKVVMGGQTMNPSTDDIAAAVREVNANHVFVLPNNPNIILAARQAAEMVDSEVHVIESKTIPQGITAMLEFNPSAGADEVAQAMTGVLGNVSTGQVTYAVRDSSFDGKEIKQGDIMGIMDGKIAVVGSDVNDVAKELLDAMYSESSEIMTIYYGQDVKEEQASELYDRASSQYDGCDVDLQYGGQPLYYYILSVE